MSNQSNVNPRNSATLTNTLLQDLQSCDFVTTFPSSWTLPTNISTENRNLDRLKTKINCFIQEHSNVIIDIKNYFYDEMITFSLKRAFKIPFNKTDMIKTEKLLNRFFIEHETNIKIIFNYFIDDIKPFLSNNRFLSLTTELRTINAVLNRGAYAAVILLLKSQGAPFLTSILYRSDIVLNPNENLPEQPPLQIQAASNQRNFPLIFAYICVLCILFGWKLFVIMFYFFIGLIIVAFFVFILMMNRTT